MAKKNILPFGWQIFDLKFAIVWHGSRELLKFLVLSLLNRQGPGGGQTDAFSARGRHEHLN